MKGTQDILAVFSNGSTMSLSAENLDYANQWVQENRDQLRLIHFGRTAVNYRGGKVVASLEMDRAHVLESI